MSEAKIDATGAAERMRKYRKKNQLKNGLTIAKQQFKRAQLLASATPDRKKLIQDAAERKRRQRMRAKEAKEKENEEGGASSLVGALKIHEILIDQNLVVKKKNLPNDPFYKSVLIKESRRKSTISNDSDSGSEFDDIVDSDD